MRGGETSLYLYSHVGHRSPGEARETHLSQPFGGEFERLYSLTQVLHIAVGIAREPAAKRSQRFHDLGSDPADRSLRCR